MVMRGLRSLAYGLLAVILGVVLAGEGFSLVAIGVLITVSLVGDMVDTYVIGLVAGTWGRRRTLALLSLLMAATGVIFGLATSYPVLLVAAFFGTLGTSASETAPFLPIDQAMIVQVTLSEHRTVLFARYNLIASLSAALGALAAGLPTLLAGVGLPLPPAFTCSSGSTRYLASWWPDAPCAFPRRWKHPCVLLSRSRAGGLTWLRICIARAKSCGG